MVAGSNDDMLRVEVLGLSSIIALWGAQQPAVDGAKCGHDVIYSHLGVGAQQSRSSIWCRVHSFGVYTLICLRVYMIDRVQQVF